MSVFSGPQPARPLPNTASAAAGGLKIGTLEGPQRRIRAVQNQKGREGKKNGRLMQGQRQWGGRIIGDLHTLAKKNGKKCGELARRFVFVHSSAHLWLGVSYLLMD